MEILQAEFDGSEIVMLVKYSYAEGTFASGGNGVIQTTKTEVTLERVQLSRDITEDQTDDKIPVLLDRRFEVGSGGSYTSGHNVPYYYLDDAGSRQSFNVAYDGVAPRFPVGHQFWFAYTHRC